MAGVYQGFGSGAVWKLNTHRRFGLGFAVSICVSASRIRTVAATQIWPVRTCHMLKSNSIPEAYGNAVSFVCFDIHKFFFPSLPLWCDVRFIILYLYSAHLLINISQKEPWKPRFCLAFAFTCEECLNPLLRNYTWLQMSCLSMGLLGRTLSQSFTASCYAQQWEMTSAWCHCHSYVVTTVKCCFFSRHKWSVVSLSFSV